MPMSYACNHTHCTITTIAHTANVPFCPKLLKKIVAMGCPIGLLRIESKSVPMQKASATLIARYNVTSCFTIKMKKEHTPTKHTSDTNSVDDGPRHSSGSVRCFLTDVHAGVEGA